MATGQPGRTREAVESRGRHTKPDRRRCRRGAKILIILASNLCKFWNLIMASHLSDDVEKWEKGFKQKRIH